MPTKTASICSNTTLRRRAMPDARTSSASFSWKSTATGIKQQLEHSGPGGAAIPCRGNVVVIMDEDDEADES